MDKRRFGSLEKRDDRGGRWYVKFRYQGAPKRRMAGRTAEEAAAKLREVEEMIAKGYSLEVIDERVFGRAPMSRLTFREAAPEYLAAVEKLKKPSTIEGDVHRLRVLCRAPWAGKPLRAVTTVDVRRWLERRRRDVSVATANRDHSLASALFQWAIGVGYATENPFRKVPKSSEKGRERSMYLTAEECQALLDASSGVLHHFILLGIYTGLRKHELFSLEWGSVDFSTRRVHVEPNKAKSGKGRYAPMTAEAEALLRRLHRERPRMSPHSNVLLTRRGRPLNSSALRVRWRRLKQGSIEGIATDRLARATAHVLRHTYASHLAQAGLPLPRLALYLGHSSAYVTERYAHLSPDRDDDVAALLSNKLAGDVETARDRASEALSGLLEITSVPDSVPGPWWPPRSRIDPGSAPIRPPVCKTGGHFGGGLCRPLVGVAHPHRRPQVRVLPGIPPRPRDVPRGPLEAEFWDTPVLAFRYSPSHHATVDSTAP
jgi:integrase